MDDRKLKEYALNIFNNVSGYSLQKAFTLFPMYYPKIAFYYSELITQKQEELTSKTIQQVGLTRAHTLVKLARETNITMEKYRYYTYNKIRSLDIYEKENEFNSYEEHTDYALYVFDEHKKILDNVTNMLKLNKAALKKIKDEANKYGFSDILDEANYYLNNNNYLLGNIIETSKYYTENYMKRLNIN